MLKHLMLKETLWVLALGLGLALHSAPARADTCDTSCERSDRGDRDSHRRGGDDYRPSGREQARDASTLQLVSTRRGDRYLPQVPVEGPPKELADLASDSRRARSSAGPGKPSNRGDFFPPGLLKQDHFVSLPLRLVKPDQPVQSPIPEPTALVLFGGGLLVAAAALRRRRI